MKLSTISFRSLLGASKALIIAAAFVAAACDVSTNVGPVGPLPISGSGLGARSLQISGTLVAEQGSTLEATVLYDGLELPGARVTCPDAGGCAALDLVATTESGAGRHSISFQVLRQSRETIRYRAEATVLVSRQNFSPVATLDLGSRRSTLGAGESVDFEIALWD